MDFPIISLIVLLPLFFAIILLFMPDSKDKDIKSLTLFFSIIILSVVIPIFILFDKPITERFFWIDREIINTTLFFKLDGLNILMILMTAILFPLIVLGSWKEIKHKVKEFCILLMITETGLLGVFCANDLFLFYLFWEIMLIPTIFIIGIWGGEERFKAALKFFIYTMFGSIILLIALIYIYINVPEKSFTNSFNLESIINFAQSGGFSNTEQIVLFLSVALAFAIKIPIVPFHTWLPITYKNAPIAGNVILAGIMAKVGTYGLIKIAIPIFPFAVETLSIIMMILGVIAIIYGAFMAYAQTDMKQLIAYSSISHLGFVVVGLFSYYSLAENITGISYQALQGALYQMFNHGLIIGGMFLLIGMLYERHNSFKIEEFGGLAAKTPVYAVIFMLLMLASVGLPGMSGFIGELLIIIGTFQANVIVGTFVSLGIIFSVVYMLLLYQKVFYGKIKNSVINSFKDMTKREVILIVPLIFIIILGGLIPNIFLEKIDKTLEVLKYVIG